MIINMFLLACEVFTEFYTDSAHVASARYLYFGLHGRHALVPWIWTADRHEPGGHGAAGCCPPRAA